MTAKKEAGDDEFLNIFYLTSETISFIENQPVEISLIVDERRKKWIN